MTSRDFAEAIAERLDEVVPDGFTVTADDVEVVLSRAILSNVQDWIAHSTALPWPGARVQPNPDAVVQGTQLTMWFGNTDSPVLRLRPLTVPVIRETE